MPPWLTLSAIKDGIIVIAILALGWWVYRSGENAVRVTDVKALQQQLAHMQQTQQEWQNEQSRATEQQQADITAINAGGVVKPVTVRLCVNRPAVEAVLPAPATAAPSAAPAARGGDVQAGPDLGPALQDYERWLETEFAQCRAVVEEWPK